MYILAKWRDAQELATLATVCCVRQSGDRLLCTLRGKKSRHNVWKKKAAIRSRALATVATSFCPDRSLGYTTASRILGETYNEFEV